MNMSFHYIKVNAAFNLVNYLEEKHIWFIGLGDRSFADVRSQ